MMAGNTIFVPDYQRAYSWDTGKDGALKNQVNTFYADIMIICIAAASLLIISDISSTKRNLQIIDMVSLMASSE